MGKLAGKIALVTGGDSGIGLATARLFKEEGATVVITCRTGDSYRRAEAILGGLFEIVQADVSKLADLDRLYAHIKEKFSSLDILFANAGIGPTAMAADVTEGYFENLFATNVKGVYFTVAKALPLLCPGASVVMTASVLSKLGRPGQSVYSATKAAVRSFARSFTAEIPPEKVRFNVISPGLTNTPGLAKAGMSEAMKNELAKLIPMQRLSTPEEIAQTVLFLAGSDSSFVAGIELFVDGGAGQI